MAVPIEFTATVRIDTPQELLYYRHGGILQYVLRQLLAGHTTPEVVSKGLATVADPAPAASRRREATRRIDCGTTENTEITELADKLCDLCVLCG